MKLIISRKQQDVKGLLGGQKGVKFSVSATAQLTQEERNLIDKYLPRGDLLFSWEYKPKNREMPTYRHITIDSLVKGQSFECESLHDIINLEEGLVEGANVLHRYLVLANSFGGEVEIDIPSMSDD
jgi:hypothetical protein